MSKKFKTAYVVERGKVYNADAIIQYADEVVFLLTGKERGEEIERLLRKNLLTFDPDVDVIITNGRLLASFVLGTIMKELPYYNLGLYQNKDYTFLRITAERTPDATSI